MADARRTLEIVLQAKDEASKVVKSFRGHFKDLVKDSQLGATVIAGGMGLVTKSLIDGASMMEQTKIAFDTMIGDGKKASKTLAEMSEFAKKTPFDLPEVLEGSKRLLAYGVNADKLIPTFKTLGNIAAGVGKDKLPQLILAFGQVSAATKLTGAELRQFSEAGVPLLEALVMQANEAGGVLTKVGGASKETTKQMASLATKIATAEFEMDYFKKTGEKTEKQLESMQSKVNLNKAKLAEFGDVGQAVYKRVKVSAEDMIQKISDGEVKFPQVQKALEGMTGEGGKFFDLMEKQSQTFSGRISNIRDQLFRLGLDIAGISTEAENFGEVVEGGAFDRLSEGVERVLQFVDTAQPRVEEFFNLIKSNMPLLVGMFAALATIVVIATAPFVIMLTKAAFLASVVGFLAGGLVWLWEKLREGEPLAWFVAAAIGGIAIAITIGAIPALVKMATTAITTATTIGVAFGPVTILILLIAALVALLATAWKNNWFDIQGHTKKAVDWMVNTAWPSIKNFFKGIGDTVGWLVGTWMDGFNKIKNFIGGVIDKVNELKNALSRGWENVTANVPKFQHGGFVPGGAGDAIPAVLHGGERIIPRTGVDVNPGGGSSNISISFTGPVSMDSSSRVDDLARKIVDYLGRQNELAARGLSI